MRQQALSQSSLRIWICGEADPLQGAVRERPACETKATSVCAETLLDPSLALLAAGSTILVCLVVNVAMPTRAMHDSGTDRQRPAVRQRLERVVFGAITSPFSGLAALPDVISMQSFRGIHMQRTRQAHRS